MLNRLHDKQLVFRKAKPGRLERNPLTAGQFGETLNTTEGEDGEAQKKSHEMRHFQGLAKLEALGSALPEPPESLGVLQNKT